jgi:indole-3-glycerol phosphate synthase
MLEKFKQAKEGEIERLRRLADAGEMPEPLPGPRPSFHDALAEAGPAAIIAEYKRASPSKGEINMELSPEEVAEAYAGAGAATLSVLTEKEHFRGELEFIERMAPAGLPMLRKDFIYDTLQVTETAATNASAVLLIARSLDEKTLTACMAEAARHNLSPVVEVFDEDDLGKARRCGAWLIQANSRDLDTLRVEPATHERLVFHKQGEELWIAASGIEDGKRISELKAMGYDAFLLGTSLMREKNPADALKRLLSEVGEF